ncbi:hypothetical protein FACS1894218_0560 [Bacilli bacterium]|nr:hypothetical protein FACS1894218_0560 [Bacilli bacterium]
MGMVATLINSLALKEVLLKHHVKAEVFSLLSATSVAPNYQATLVNKNLDKNVVCILAGGTGKPFFSTDTGAAKDAQELHAHQIVMGKDGVDGIYSDDPKKNKQATRFNHLSFKEVISKKLKVMDLAALKICQAHKINILVFNIERPNAIIKALKKQIPTTVVDNK